MWVPPATQEKLDARYREIAEASFALGGRQIRHERLGTPQTTMKQTILVHGEEIPRPFKRQSSKWILVVTLGLLALESIGMGAPSGKRLYYNQDCTEFFAAAQIPARKAGETIDRYVDGIAGAGVTVFLCNSNARRTNYRSRVWDAFWDGYDPAGPDDQPFLAPIPRSQVAASRKGLGNMLAVLQEGIDYPARVIQRCRHDGMSPWITLRMNDCHENDIPTHPFHGSFWVKNPQLRRKNCSGYFATCLDYSNLEVRDFYMSLIVETLDRYDIDGLELDFMREPYVFSADKEREGAPILTGWLREVRKRTADAAAKRGHPVRLGVRVPSRPEVAVAMGLDAITWASEGLIDVLVTTPRWATLEFDLPIPQWRQSLGKSKVTLVGGLEVLYRPAPDSPPSVTSPELAIGAATSVLSQGADAVYLFNYFPGTYPQPIYQETLKSMASLGSVRKLPRRVGVTYRDITAPGEQYTAPLPATGKEAAFRIRLGPVPNRRWLCDVVIGDAPAPGALKPGLSVLVNGTPCKFLNEESAKDGLRLVSFRVPTLALRGTELHEVKVASREQSPLNIRQVEMFLRPPGKANRQPEPPPARSK